MASTLLERTRESHEEIERLERAICADFRNEAVTHKERLAQNHRVRSMLDDMADKSKRLRAVYEDADGVRKEEIEALGGGSNVFSAFYDRLKETRDYHKQFAGYHAPLSDEFLRQYRDGKPPEFSGEEASGRYLDLHAHHRQFQNAPFGSKDCEYIAYLSVVGDFEPIPREKKFTKAYEEYLSGLVGYLRGFHARVKPLVFLDTVTRKAEEEFEERWATGAIPGWEDKGLVAVKSNADAVDLDAFNSAAEMETAVGTDKIKEALASMGLKQGGTPEQRRDRLWSTRGKSPGEIDKKLFAKGAVCAGSDVADAKKKEERAKGIARAEGTVETLLEHLRQQLEATKGNVEKKATLSLAELEAEAEEDDDWVEEEEEDEEEEIYNPLKLPMGWDGKPIPYWLYKLHGLNLEFTCEICGNYSYWGRRAYERHFKEFRHQHGMRCLGIPNTKAFAEVTTIADALALQKALDARKVGQWKRETDEECEDADGNVYNKKTYEDLRRQGLI